MINPIVEMRCLHCKPYHELMQIAIDKYGFCPNGKSISKVELITYIIAFAAMRGDIDPIASQESKNDNKRTRFILDSDGDTYHIMLTKEQTDFMDWCFKNCIDFSCAGAEEIKDVNWEMP